MLGAVLAFVGALPVPCEAGGALRHGAAQRSTQQNHDAPPPGALRPFARSVASIPALSDLASAVTKASQGRLTGQGAIAATGMRPHLALLAALLLAGASAAAAAYSCDATTCAAPDCQCASTSAPGGLSRNDTPMFVLITHDDSVNTLQDRVVRTVTDGFVNKNGCNVPATWFAIKNKSNCTFVQQLIKDNHEIAGHTVNHSYMFANLTVDEMKAEVEGIREYLVEECKVPADKLKGFRAPYLVHNEQFRSVLQEAGFQYDSSIMEPSNTETSPSWAQRTFPYTMDAGVPQDCGWPGNTEMSCSTDERHAGLWEVPVWMLPSAEGENGFTMDPEAASSDQLYELLKTSFDAAYEGNRAPFPIFLHAPWFTYNNSQGFLRFMEYATDKPNTWFVTVSQLLDWMKAPVPASQVGNTLTCSMVELTPPTADWCRQYKAGPVEDIWTVGAKWGISTDAELLAVSEHSIVDKETGSTIWSIPEGTIINLPPWDERCDEPGATFFPENDWYNPVYIQKPAIPVAAPVKAPAPAPAAVPVAAPTPAPVTVPAPAPATAPAPSPAVAVAAPTPDPIITTGTTAPTPQDTRTSAAVPATSGGAATLLLAAVAALCLLL